MSRHFALGCLFSLRDRPGLEDEGPPGPRHSSLQVARRERAARPLPRPAARALNRELSAHPPTRTQDHMSTQATLVNPGPSQMPNAVAAAQRQLHPEKAVKKRRIQNRPHSMVPIESLLPEGTRVRPLPTGKNKGKARMVNRSEEPEEDDIRPGGFEDLVVTEQSYPIGQTNEEERDVEELLEANASDESNRHLSPEIPYEPSGRMESDDERARQKLLPSPPQPQPSASSVSEPSTSLKRKFVLPDGDDDIYIENFTQIAPPPRRASAISSPSRSHASASRVLMPVTPRVQRSTSSESVIPFPGTRASAVNRRAMQETSYTPPPGTKAAKVVSAQKLHLRSRVVARQ